MKKRILCGFIAVLMIVLILPIQAFAATNIKGAYVGQNFESHFDTVLGAKMYSIGGSLPEGLKFSGKWSNKATFGDVVFSATISGTPTKAGTYNFSVNYLKDDGKTIVATKSYTITVGEKAPFDYVGSIIVEKWPNKTEYYLGDTIDLTGMKVTAVVYTYNTETKNYDPSQFDVTDLVSVDPTIFTFDEPQDVTVSLKAPGNSMGTLETFSDIFRVGFKYANPEDITRIEIYKKPSKLTYTVGENLDLTGMTIRAHKGNGTAEDITTGFTADVTKLDEVGTETVTVSYAKNNQTFTATFDVTVTEAVSSQPEEPKESSSSSSSEPEPSSEPEVPEESSEPEISEESSEPEVPDEPVSSESEASEESSEPDEIIVSSQPEAPEDDDEKDGIPFWVWIIIGLLVILIAAAVALFLIGRKRISDDDYDDEE